MAVHAVTAEAGVTIIDAGLPGLRRPLLRELRRQGWSPETIRGIVLTHGDPDHTGFAERLRTDLGIPVFVGADDVIRAQGQHNSAPTWGRVRVGPTAAFLTYAALLGGLRPQYVRDVRAVSDGDVLDLPGSPRVMMMPGHSPGSIAVHFPDVRAVFVGDALTTRHVLTGQRGPQPAPFSEDPEAAHESAEQLRRLDVDWVIPGHGAPWHGDTTSLLDAYHTARS